MLEPSLTQADPIRRIYEVIVMFIIKISKLIACLIITYVFCMMFIAIAELQGIPFPSEAKQVGAVIIFTCLIAIAISE